MSRLFGVAFTGLLIGFVSLAAAADADDNAKNIVGKWEIVKSGSDLPKGSTMDFTKDGKMTAIIKGDDPKKGDDVKLEGTYKVDKDKLSVKLKSGDQSIDETVTILKLTADTLEVKDKDSKVDSFKKTK